MTEKEYIDVQNLTAVRIIRAARSWTNSDKETIKYFKKIDEGVSGLVVILNNRVVVNEDSGDKKGDE